MFAAVADAWKRDGSAAAAEAAKAAGIEITAAQLDALAKTLATTNGTRKTRLLDPAQIFDAIALAITDERGVGFVHGGEANDGTQRTSLCLAFREGNSMTVGVGLSRARSAGPGVTWRALQPWSRTAPDKNVERLRKWAGTKAKDRAAFMVKATKPFGARSLGDSDALLAAVLADPTDDAPRAVYADRLIELGDPRGDFITVQLALAKTKPGKKPDELAGESAALLEEHAAKWSRDVAQLTLKQFYARGFIYRVEMRARAFVTDGARLFELAPIESVKLRNVDSSTLRKLATTPALAKVRELELDDRIGDPGAKLLAEGGQLQALRRIDLFGCGVGHHGVEALLAAMPKLDTINVNLTERIAAVVLRYQHVVAETYTKPRTKSVAALETAGRLRMAPKLE